METNALEDQQHTWKHVNLDPLWSHLSAIAYWVGCQGLCTSRGQRKKRSCQQKNAWGQHSSHYYTSLLLPSSLPVWFCYVPYFALVRAPGHTQCATNSFASWCLQKPMKWICVWTTKQKGRLGLQWGEGLGWPMKPKRGSLPGFREGSPTEYVILANPKMGAK